MTANPFAALPRYSLIDGNMTRATSGDYVHVSDLAALSADYPADLAEAGKVLEGVTPGPWRVGPVDDCRVEDANGNEVAQIDGDYNQPETWPQMEANARFIAWCREGVPALIALATAQAARIEGLEATVERFVGAHERHLVAGAKTREQAEARIAALEATVERMRGALVEARESAMQELASLGQAQEAYEAQVAAETALAAERAKVAKLVEALQSIANDVDLMATGQTSLLGKMGRTARAAITEAGQ